MRRIQLLLVVLLSCSFTAFAQETLSQEQIMAKVSKGKPYTLVILKKGTVTSTDANAMKTMQMEHLANLFQLEKAGKISIFGPVNNDDILQGIIVFNSINKDDIKKEMSKDPFIKSGYMSYELHDWFSIPGQKLPE